MKEFCENSYCETPAMQEVPVSVKQPGDEKRSLCATCAEAYTWGVQHGRISTERQVVAALEHLCRRGGWIVLGCNRHDPHPGLAFEAWAYQGPMDFSTAAPISFGLGAGVHEALAALNQQLKQGKGSGKPMPPRPALMVTPPLRETDAEPLWRVVYVIDVPGRDAQAAARLAHQIMTYPDSLAPVLDIIDGRGKVVRIDLSEYQGNNPGKEGITHE